MKSEKTLRVKHRVLFIDKLKTIENVIDSLIYLSFFNLLPRFLTSDPLILPNFLYWTFS